MNSFEKSLKQTIMDQGPHSPFAPSVHIQAYLKGRKKIDLNIGQTYKYYDLSSLTKIIFTTTALMKLVSCRTLNINQQLGKILNWWPYTTTLKKHLNHSAGMIWWTGLPTSISQIKSKDLKRDAFKKKLIQLKPQETQRSIYSDPDFWLLGFVLEELYQQPLEKIWQSIQNKHQLKSLHFCVNNKPKYKKMFYAPTADLKNAKKKLQGLVNDDNAQILGGVAAHSGLFGRIQDVSDWGLLLRKSYLGINQSLAKTSVVQKFCKRSLPRSQGDWGLGFTLPQKESSKVGSRFSLQSVGHWGFSGTSLWWDPKVDLLVTVLSNRVYYGYKDIRFNSLRPLIHDSIHGMLI